MSSFCFGFRLTIGLLSIYNTSPDLLFISGWEIPLTNDEFKTSTDKFKDKFKFPFPLLADEDKSVIQAFGVWGPKKFMGKEYDGIHRTTFIINEEGIIDEVISDVKTKAHAAQILK